MTLIAWDGGPIFRDGAVGTETDCCCGSDCNVNDTQCNSETSSAKDFEYVFPSSRRCVKIVITITGFGGFDLTVIALQNGVPGSGVTIYPTTSIISSTTLCLEKPDGKDRVLLRIRNDYGTWCLTITCDTCDCNPLP